MTNRQKMIPSDRKPRTSKNKYFSDLILSSEKPASIFRRTAKKTTKKCDNKRWKSTDNKMKNHTGCFSNFDYISHPYKGAYDKVSTFVENNKEEINLKFNFDNLRD